MLERLRATLFLDKYENEGRKLAVFMVLFDVSFFWYNPVNSPHSFLLPLPTIGQRIMTD